MYLKILVLLLLFGTTTPQMDIPRDELDTIATAEEKIIDQAERLGLDSSVAVRIARCESGLRQFDDQGRPLRGQINPLDTGIFQLNEKYHLANCQRLGFDIYTEKGNIDCALNLMKREGTTPWNWSRQCWGVDNFEAK